MPMDDISYSDLQKQKMEEHESLCKRCGLCCGAGGSDPCASLVRGYDGKYGCAKYPVRLGVQATVSGRHFTCVEMRDLKKFGIPHEGCGYI